MANQPTVGTLAARAIELAGAALTEAMARSFIRSNNIRSLSKLETLTNEQLVGKTEDELKTLIPVTEADEAKTKAAATKPAATKPATKTTAPKTKDAKPKAEKKAAEPKFPRKGREPREAKLVNEGPRGFRFGPKWNESVIAGQGIALLDSNKNKLLKQAVSLGINRFTMEDSSEKIAKAIAPKVEASMQQTA